MNSVKCEDCNGTKLKKESLYFKINNKTIVTDIDNYMDSTKNKRWVSQKIKRK